MSAASKWAAFVTALAGVGAWFYGKREKKGIRAPSRFRGQVKRGMDEIERVAPIQFAHDNIRMRTVKADRLDGDLPVYYSQAHGKEIGGHARNGREFLLAVWKGAIHGGALLHELWHVLLWQHGVEVGEHHDIMKRYGVYGA